VTQDTGQGASILLVRRHGILIRKKSCRKLKNKQVKIFMHLFKFFGLFAVSVKAAKGKVHETTLL